MNTRSSLVACGLLLAALACRDQTEAPTEPAPAPAVRASPAPSTLQAAPVANGKIAFASTRGVSLANDSYLMEPNGTAPTQLTTYPGDDYTPAWSPDGRKLAFTSFRDGNAEIYVMNADGSGQKRLTSDQAFDANPTWSPDGTRIAFQSDRAIGRTEIYVMHADGGDPARLTYSAWDVENYEPAWSPDGTKL